LDDFSTSSSGPSNKFPTVPLSLKPLLHPSATILGIKKKPKNCPECHTKTVRRSDDGSIGCTVCGVVYYKALVMVADHIANDEDPEVAANNDAEDDGTEKEIGWYDSPVKSKASGKPKSSASEESFLSAEEPDDLAKLKKLIYESTTKPCMDLAKELFMEHLADEANDKEEQRTSFVEQFHRRLFRMILLAKGDSTGGLGSE
jgi:ribosomal protein L37AE/L43A